MITKANIRAALKKNWFFDFNEVPKQRVSFNWPQSAKEFVNDLIAIGTHKLDWKRLYPVSIAGKTVGEIELF
jgi:hypothetical protein